MTSGFMTPTEMARQDAALNANAYIVSTQLVGAYPTVNDALDQAKADDPPQIVLGFMPMEEYDFSANPILLDGERDYAFVGLGGGIQSNVAPSPHLIGNIDTTPATPLFLAGNRRITFHNLTYSGEFTLRKARFLQVNDGAWESSRLIYAYSDAVFDGPFTRFQGTDFNGGFNFDHIDTPAGFVVSQLIFHGCRSILFNDVAGVPFKLGGNLGPIISFSSSHLSSSIDGTSVFDFENTNTIVEFFSSTWRHGGLNPPGPLFANAASGRVRWEGESILYRDWGSSTYALDLAGPTHDTGAPVIDTGVAPLNRPTGTRYRDRGGTERILVWDGAAWV